MRESKKRFGACLAEEVVDCRNPYTRNHKESATPLD
jgi:hypothetical protein